MKIPLMWVRLNMTRSEFNNVVWRHSPDGSFIPMNLWNIDGDQAAMPSNFPQINVVISYFLRKSADFSACMKTETKD